MIAGESAVANARTTYEALANSALQGNRASGAWKSVAREVRPGKGVSYQITIPGATPAWRQFTGTRVRQGARKYSKTIGLKKYDKTLELERESVEYDTDGSTAILMEQHLNDGESFWDKMVFESLGSNPTGADGVSLINDAHPYASGGGTWDNKTTSALGFGSYNTERARMKALLDEYGEPLNLNPDTLVCHPDDEEIALQIIGANSDVKPVAVGTAGAINTTGIGGSTITNVFRGTATLVLTPRFTSGDWVIVDSRYAPIFFCVWKEPTVNVVDSMQSHTVVENDVFLYQQLADAAADGVQPWGIAGKIT